MLPDEKHGGIYSSA